MFCPTDPYVEYLRTRKGRRVCLKPYWGNSGDALIWMGNEVLLKELGLLQVVNPRDADIILWPGGNPTMWPANLEGWKECLRLWPEKEFVIGPATFHTGKLDWGTLLRTSRGRIGGVFARDPESYKNLRQAGLAPAVTIGLGHDPALHLKDTDWLLEHRDAVTSEYILASFRSDHEAVPLAEHLPRWLGQIVPGFVRRRLQARQQLEFLEARLQTARKVSGSEALKVCDASAMSFQSFVECVRRASQVHTDRLHCLLLAVLLGKPSFGYPTSYGKLEAVYEHSLKSWASVQFVKD